MKERLIEIVETFHKYNSEHMAAQTFGLSEDVVYDALVVAPSYTPYRISVRSRRWRNAHISEVIWSRETALRSRGSR